MTREDIIMHLENIHGTDFTRASKEDQELMIEKEWKSHQERMNRNPIFKFEHEELPKPELEEGWLLNHLTK